MDQITIESCLSHPQLAVWKGMHPLERELYQNLSRRGFEFSMEPKVPGFVCCARRYGIEVAGAPFGDELRIDVAIPVYLPSNEFFQKAECAGSEFLVAAEVPFATPLTITKACQRTDEIVLVGALVYLRGKLEKACR